MQTQTTIESLQAQIRDLEEQKRKAFETERNAQLLVLAHSVGINITIESTKGILADIWDDTEIFSFRISFTENVDGICYGSGCSVGYIVSRKAKKVIGQCGGGQCWLPRLNEPKRELNTSPYSVLKERVIETVNRFLENL